MKKYVHIPTLTRRARDRMETGSTQKRNKDYQESKREDASMVRSAMTAKTPVPESFEALKSAIAGRYPSLSRQLQKIARFALENPDELALETVTTVAQRAEVQPSSMVRFAQAIGFDGFSTMQQVFRSNLMASTLSYRERIQSLRKNRGAPFEDPDAVIADFVDDGIAALEMLRDHIPRERLSQAVDILADAEGIYVLAQGRAFPVAFYLSYALSRLERRCHLLDGVGGLLRQQADLVTAKDAVIAVSFHPYSPMVVDIVTERSEKGVPIVAITDSPLSPLALEGRVAFEIRDNRQRPFRSLVAPMCLAQSLVDSLGHRMAEKIGKNAK